MVKGKSLLSKAAAAARPMGPAGRIMADTPGWAPRGHIESVTDPNIGKFYPRRTHSYNANEGRYPGMAEGTPLAAMRKGSTDFGSPFGGPKASLKVAANVFDFDLMPSAGVASLPMPEVRPRVRGTPKGWRTTDGPTGNRGSMEIGGPTTGIIGGADSLRPGGPPASSLGRFSDGPQGSKSSPFVHDLSAPDIGSKAAPIPGLMSPDKAAVADLARSDINGVQRSLYGDAVGTRIVSPDRGMAMREYNGIPSASEPLHARPSGWMKGETYGPIRHSPGAATTNTPASNPAVAGGIPWGSMAQGVANVGMGMMAGGVTSYATGGEFGQGAIAGGMLGSAAYGATRFGGMGLRNAGRAMTAGSASRGFAMQGSAAMAGFNTATNRAGMFAGGAMLGGFVFGGHRQSKKRGFNSNRGNSF